VNVFEGTDDPVDAYGAEVWFGGGAEDAQDFAAGSDACADAGGSVFDDEAVGGSGSDQCGAADVRFWIRFSALNHVSADDVRWDGELGCFQAAQEETVRGGGDDGPAVGREACEEGAHAGEDLEVGDVVDLQVFDDAEAFGNVEAGL
jgi:hypothetical protein